MQFLEILEHHRVEVDWNTIRKGGANLGGREDVEVKRNIWESHRIPQQIKLSHLDSSTRSEGRHQRCYTPNAWRMKAFRNPQ